LSLHTASLTPPQLPHERELTGWLKKREREYPGITERLHAWAARAKLPVRILGWDVATTKRAYETVQKAIDEIDGERQGKSAEEPAPVPTSTNGAYSHSIGKH
jgi:hypothetical protein